jgi:hypothetical protein
MSNIDMKMNIVEIGDVSDQSGWKRRVKIDKQKSIFEIEFEGRVLSAHPREIQWLIKALDTAHDSVY